MSAPALQFARAQRVAESGFSGARAPIASSASVAGTPCLDNTDEISFRRQRSARRERYRLRSILHAESSLRRLQMCGRRRIRDAEVGIYRDARGAHFGNVMACGSIHSCPTCAPKIRQRRAQEIDRAVRAHLDHSGNSALFMTFTLPHDFGDALAPLLKTVASCFRQVIGGRGYVADKLDYSITGSIRASETTFGKSGAHPHLHVIFFLDRSISPGELQTLHSRLFTRWSSAVERVGYRVPLIGLCPVERVTTAQLGAYVNKMASEDLPAVTAGNRRLGMEMTRHDLKGARRQGRTPFQVLRDFAVSGDCADLDLWREWERASQGTQSLTWSKGLKARYSVADKSDEELAAEREGGELVATLTVTQWNLVNSVRGGDVQILEAAEHDGADGVQLWLFDADIQRLKRLHARMRAA